MSLRRSPAAHGRGARRRPRAPIPPTTVAARGRMSKIVLPIMVLPAPLSPTRPRTSPGSTREADAAQQALAGMVPERDREIGNLEIGRRSLQHRVEAVAAAPRRTGRRRARSGTARSSGKTSTHQAKWMMVRPSAIMPPQVGSSVEIERFTKERIASTMTAIPISSDSSATIAGSTFGSTSFSRMVRSREAGDAGAVDIVHAALTTASRRAPRGRSGSSRSRRWR